ncbi:MAG TPA: MFS transporter [Candidimonas sp.]|nr:MFS transporter [Candidimonas sp.]
MTEASPATDRQARRSVGVLMAAQALGGASPPIIISLGGIVGLMLASDPTLSTLPVSLYNLGLALSTLPAALLMRQMGRRVAYLLGALLGSASGLVAAMAILRGDFVLFCIGTSMAGFYGACVQSYRFAAADAVAPALRSVAISRVMVGGLAAAIIGPQLVIWTRDALPAAPFAGSFFAQAALACLALPIIAMFRTPGPTSATASGPPARPLSEIARTPQFCVAVVAGVVTYGLMSFVMTASPMAMVACGHTIGEAALGIQWHVLAMFSPSFFTGHLIARFGKPGMTAIGLVMIAASALLALAGLELLNFWGSLVLLGVGWNFGFIGATAMLTDCYHPSERAKVQGLNDFLVFGTVAIASFSSGQLLNTSGWATINMLMFPLVATVLALLGWLAWRKSQESAAAPASQ